jgi:hypothetical protein
VLERLTALRAGRSAAATALLGLSRVVPERPFARGPPGKQGGGGDLLYKYKNCYNSNTIPDGEHSSLCST